MILRTSNKKIKDNNKNEIHFDQQILTNNLQKNLQGVKYWKGNSNFSTAEEMQKSLCNYAQFMKLRGIQKPKQTLINAPIRTEKIYLLKKVETRKYTTTGSEPLDLRWEVQEGIITQ